MRRLTPVHLILYSPPPHSLSGNKVAETGLDSDSQDQRRLIKTKGYIGLLHHMTRPGVLVKGVRFLLIIRPRSEGRWELIGDAYVVGIMHGEAFDENRCFGVI
jgi:hypothetical protein